MTLKKMKLSKTKLQAQILKKIAIILMITAGAALFYSAISRAQDLDDTLESELDALAAGLPETSASPNASPTPTPSDEFADEAPLADPFGDEGNQQADSDLLPLEAPTNPPPKAASKNARKTEPPITEPLPPIDEPDAAISEVAPAREYRDSLAPASDEPNSAFEARLAAIYSQHSEPVSNEKWTDLIGARGAESYSVQAGDTLWDLSSTLFADGFYWSKLWAENPEIQNPHKIAKGQAIRFIGGTESTPPEVRVVKDEPDQLTLATAAAFEKEDFVPAMVEPSQDELVDFDSSSIYPPKEVKEKGALNSAPYYQEDIEGKITQADIEAGVVLEQSEIVPRPVLPPPSEQRRKVLLDIPYSFRELVPQKYDRTVTIQRRDRAAERIPGAVVPGFIAFENMPEPMGTIDEVDHGELIASIGQYVYIRGNEALTIGGRYYSITPRFDVKSSKNGRIGSAAEIGGVLRIIERVDEKTNLYRAMVVFGVNPVRVGSLVLIGDPPRIPVSTKGRRLNEELIVAGGGDSNSRPFFGDGATVFLDTQSSGVRVGDVLSIQARRGTRKQSVAPEQLTPIGILKVFAVSGRIASAIVVLATEEVRVGDRTGGEFPRRLPDLRIETPRMTKAPTE